MAEGGVGNRGGDSSLGSVRESCERQPRSGCSRSQRLQQAADEEFRVWHEARQVCASDARSESCL